MAMSCSIGAKRALIAFFSADQASDGMLRFFALVALLLQPAADLPGVLILDEPELGLIHTRSPPSPAYQGRFREHANPPGHTIRKLLNEFEPTTWSW